MKSARRVTSRPTLTALLPSVLAAVTERHERTNERTDGDGITQKTPIYIDPPTCIGDQKVGCKMDDKIIHPVCFPCVGSGWLV